MVVYKHSLLKAKKSKDVDLDSREEALAKNTLTRLENELPLDAIMLFRAYAEAELNSPSHSQKKPKSTFLRVLTRRRKRNKLDVSVEEEDKEDFYKGVLEDNVTDLVLLAARGVRRGVDVCVDGCRYVFVLYHLCFTMDCSYCEDCPRYLVLL